MKSIISDAGALGDAERLCTCITEGYVTLMAAVYPIFTGKEGYIEIMEKKFAFFAIATVVYAAAAAALSVWGRLKPRPRMTDVFALAFAVAAVISTALSDTPVWFSYRGRCDGLATYLLYAVIFVLVSRFGKARLRTLLCFEAGYTFCAVVVILQLFGKNPLKLYPNDLNYYRPYVQEVMRFLGTLGNEDLTAAYHCMGTALAASGLAFCRGRARLLLLIPLVLGTVCIIWSGVFFTIAAAALTLAVFGPLLFNEALPEKRRLKRRHLLLISAGILLIGAVFVYLAPAGDSGVMYELNSVLHGRVEDSFGSHRVQIWRETGKVIKERPVFGVGPNALGGRMDITFRRYSEALEEEIVTGVDNAHNEYLNLLAFFGLAGFAPAMLSVGTVFCRGARRFGENRAASVLLPAVFCVLAQAFFNIGMCPVTAVSMVGLGLLAGITEKKHDL